MHTYTNFCLIVCVPFGTWLVHTHASNDYAGSPVLIQTAGVQAFKHHVWAQVDGFRRNFTAQQQHNLR